MNRIYLDHTATTPLDPRVLEAMLPYFSETFGNASSVHWYGQQSKRTLERSRETIAQAIGVHSSEIFFTSGGTEADNQAIVGVAHEMRKSGKNHIITSQAEHHAVLGPCEELQKEGFEVTYLPVDRFGMITAAQVSEAVRPATGLVSIMHANNEVGTVSPIKEIARVLHERGVLVHTDAVQSLGRIPLDVGNLGVDLMSLSAHKMYGPKGIGALVVKKGVGMEPLLHGGGQERGKRPGTENVPLAVGFSRAVEIAVWEMEDESTRLEVLRDQLEEGIRREFPAALINGHPTDRLPHILNVSFDNARMQLEGEMLVMNMDLQGIAVTSGSACTSGSMQPSHVLLAMGRDERTAKATLRFSFGKSNTTDDVGYVLEILKSVLHRMAQ